MSWWVYLLRCRDGSLYAGCTTDLQRRLAMHNAGTGAKYTRSRRPVALVYQEPCETKSEALKRELALKRLTKAQKEALVSEFERSIP